MADTRRLRSAFARNRGRSRSLPQFRLVQYPEPYSRSLIARIHWLPILSLSRMAAVFSTGITAQVATAAMPAAVWVPV